jgi:flagellar biogenesis protein FliO
MNLCLLLILVAVLLLRRRLHRAASEGEQVGARIVARLTPKVAIYRLKVSGEELLLGVSGEQVSLLARLNGMAQSHMSDKEAVPR